MKTQFNIEKVLEFGKLRNELEYERALIADRKLRILSKENYRLKPLRKKLRDLIEQYEDKNWSSNSEISELQMRESDLAELIAEKAEQAKIKAKPSKNKGNTSKNRGKSNQTQANTKDIRIN